MTDLRNKIDEHIKTDVNAVQQLVNKYTPVLEGILPEKNIPYLAVIIDKCVLYLNGSHGATDKDWKAWSVLLIKKMFEANKLEKEDDIHNIIDEFLEYKDNEYQKFCDDIISATDYDRYRGFMFRFYLKKINSNNIN